MGEGNPSPAENISSVAWPDFIRFVRQLSHDLRNHLNALELQAVFINELTTDAEMKSEIRRLRETSSEITAALQKLSTALTEPRPNKIPYAGEDLMKDIQTKFENEFPERKSRVEWRITPSGSKLEVDPQLLEHALFELLNNAFRFSEADARFEVESGESDQAWSVTLREPKKAFSGSTSEWGRQPLAKVSHAHYSLGLNRVRAIVVAHNGDFRAEFDPVSHSLVTTIVLPLLPPGT